MNTDDPKAAESALSVLAQATLNLPALQQYYHEAELPERSPLVVVGDAFSGALATLQMFGKPVVVKREAELKQGEPVFRFKRIERKGESAQVEFEYTPEGVHGQAAFVRSGTAWQAVDVSLAER